MSRSDKSVKEGDLARLWVDDDPGTEIHDRLHGQAVLVLGMWEEGDVESLSVWEIMLHDGMRLKVRSKFLEVISDVQQG